MLLSRVPLLISWADDPIRDSKDKALALREVTGSAHYHRRLRNQPAVSDCNMSTSTENDNVKREDTDLAALER